MNVFFPFWSFKNLAKSKLRQMSSILLTSVQKLRNICSWQKCGICGFRWCCSKMADIEYWLLFVVGLDKVTTKDNLCPNFVYITFKVEIVYFFQHPPFFHKKWLINIYFTSENHNSLRKYHSKQTLTLCTDYSFHQWIYRKTKANRVAKLPLVCVSKGFKKITVARSLKNSKLHATLTFLLHRLQPLTN